VLSDRRRVLSDPRQALGTGGGCSGRRVSVPEPVEGQSGPVRPPCDGGGASRATPPAGRRSARARRWTSRHPPTRSGRPSGGHDARR